MDTFEILSSHFLFRSCNPALLTQATTGCVLTCFETGQNLKPNDAADASEAPFLCILIQGTAAVYAPGEGSDCLLRILHAGDTFGVANLFSDATPVTRVVAVKPTQALCMNQETMRFLLTHDPDLAMRYIAFLADRIRFLNKRIACLGAGSAARRLAAWLDSTAPDDATVFPMSLPMNHLADVLGLGRASLYRVLDRLEAQGFVRRDGKNILFTDRAGMRQTFGLL